MSLERADASGEVLPLPVRQTATQEAARSLSREAPAVEQDRFFEERARAVIAYLASHHPAIEAATSLTHRLRLLGPAILAVAAGLGAASQILGSEPFINILSFPLIGILGWNAGVYLLGAVQSLARWRRGPGPVPEGESGISPDGAGTRLSEWLECPGTGRAPPDLPPLLRQGLGDFRRRWHRLHAPITLHRLRSLLHLAAATLAAAALAGMYAKGIANEYRAYWESTFLTPASLHHALRLVLGPASFVSGIPIPDAASLATLRRSPADSQPAGGEIADRWIHLYALTIALFVIGPRLLLAFGQAGAARIGEAALDPRSLPAAGLYFERILAEALGTALPVRAFSYCHRLSPTAEAALRRDLENALAVPVRIDWMDPVPLGGEAGFLDSLARAAADLPAHLVLVADLAATPEDETHGELVRQTRDMLAREAPETRLHLRLDAEAYDASRRRLADFSVRRSDRVAAWRAIAGPLRNDVWPFPEGENGVEAEAISR